MSEIASKVPPVDEILPVPQLFLFGLQHVIPATILAIAVPTRHRGAGRRAERRQMLYIKHHSEASIMSVAPTTAAEGFPRRAFTIDDVGRMIDAGIIREDEKFELIEGEIVMMAAKGLAHERIKSALTIAVVRALPDQLTVGVEVTLRLTDTIMLEPDIAVFPKDLFKKPETRFARLDPGEAELVIEVAASNIAYDRGLKARLYARHRVRELWVIDANARIAWIHTGPAGDGWSSIVQRGPQDALTTPALPGFSIRLDEA